jgi:hypothetical protein
MLNRRITLKLRPTGIPGPEHFSADAVPIRPLESDELLVETMYISIDPAMRSWISDASGYARGVELGDWPCPGQPCDRIRDRRPGAGTHRVAIASGVTRAANPEARFIVGLT